MIRRIDQVTYEVDLPREFVVVHLVFHVLMLWKFLVDPTQVIPIEGMELSEHLLCEEIRVTILDG